MAQLDDIVGAVMKKLKDEGLEEDTILAFTTDNGTENFTWPDGGQTPFAGGKGTVMEGGFRVPCIVRWPGKVPAGKVENGLISGLDWFPTCVAAAGNPDIIEELKKGKTLGDRTYKVHLDGYNQLDLITGKGPSQRKELFYFAESTLGAMRIGDYKYRFIDQPNGWLGGTVKPAWPILTNLRLDPFERTGITGSINYYNWYAYQFWRFVYVAAAGRQVRRDVHRVPADAEGGQLQPGGRQATDPRGGQGASGQVSSRGAGGLVYRMPPTEPVRSRSKRRWSGLGSIRDVGRPHAAGSIRDGRRARDCARVGRRRLVRAAPGGRRRGVEGVG